MIMSHDKYKIMDAARDYVEHYADRPSDLVIDGKAVQRVLLDAHSPLECWDLAEQTLHDCARLMLLYLGVGSE